MNSTDKKVQDHRDQNAASQDLRSFDSKAGYRPENKRVSIRTDSEPIVKTERVIADIQTVDDILNVSSSGRSFPSWSSAEETTRQIVEKLIEEGDALGEGAFGSVKTVHTKSGAKWALKQVHLDSRYINRELVIIKRLTHPCISRLAVYWFDYDKDKVYLHMLIEMMPQNLYSYIRETSRRKKPRHKLMPKIQMWQLFRSVASMHQDGIVHRDLKPQNILFDPHTCQLKLCDFGAAKKVDLSSFGVSYICSRYYRAPELMFGATQYGVEIDLWSLGCVIGEIIYGYPIFVGSSTVQQLAEIIAALGEPTEGEMKAMGAVEFEEDWKMPDMGSRRLGIYFKKLAEELEEKRGTVISLDPDFTNLMMGLLVYDPNKRLRCTECLEHPYFKELHTAAFVKKYPKVARVTHNWTLSELEHLPEYITVNKCKPV